MALISTLLKATESITPLSTMTKLSGFITSKPLGFFTQLLIKQFIQAYNINMNEIKEPDLTKYKTFNDFFTRELKEGQRPIDPTAAVVSPVDGTIGYAGTIASGRMIQAKGIDYSLLELLGGNKDDERFFKDKGFTCIYLSPSNYHRIHMPIDGQLIKTIHIPGKHFPVGYKNISYLENLYTLNERLVCMFKTQYGMFCIVMVAAALVGGIQTSWEGIIKRKKGIAVTDYRNKDYMYSKGAEIGMFKYGSTVICLWENPKFNIRSQIKNSAPIKYGEGLLDILN